MTTSPYQPIFEFTRGEAVESIHCGAAAVVDTRGKLVAWYGNPDAITFLRSTAKPFQALPFITHGGQDNYHLSPREIALMCASHSGTDEHVAVAKSIQDKTGVMEADLMCGTHYPLHEPTATALRKRDEKPTSNRHNCSGKHTGMLAFARMVYPDEPQVSLPYIDFSHPIQQEILLAFAEMCALQPAQVILGVDGCSAPNFAVPLRNAALAYARLCDPEMGGVFPRERANACRIIAQAMMASPDMVGGPGRFDTLLMETGQGRILAKGGAEGYQGIGLMPGALGEGSPALGITIKIGDGDARDKVASAVTLEILRQLNALSPEELESLSEFGPTMPVYNWRKVQTGLGYPSFTLQRAD